MKKLKKNVDLLLMAQQQKVPIVILTTGQVVKQAELFKELFIQMEVEKYITKTFKPLVSSNPQLLSEYESVKTSARMAMKMWILYKDSDAQEMVSSFGKKSYHLLILLLS